MVDGTDRGYHASPPATLRSSRGRRALSPDEREEVRSRLYSVKPAKSSPNVHPKGEKKGRMKRGAPPQTNRTHVSAEERAAAWLAQRAQHGPATPDVASGAGNAMPPQSNRNATTARTARTARTSRTSRDHATFWNAQYKPTPVGTAPIPVVHQPQEGWVGIGGAYQRQGHISRGTERRVMDPMADASIFLGTRTHSAKEAGPARVPQQWKEGLRQIVPDPLSAEQAEVEQLRVLLRRGAGIGTPDDDYTPYHGRTREEIIQAAVRKYVSGH